MWHVSQLNGRVMEALFWKSSFKPWAPLVPSLACWRTNKVKRSYMQTSLKVCPFTAEKLSLELWQHLQALWREPKLCSALCKLIVKDGLACLTIYIGQRRSLDYCWQGKMYFFSSSLTDCTGTHTHMRVILTNSKLLLLALPEPTVGQGCTKRTASGSALCLKDGDWIKTLVSEPCLNH